MKIDDLLNVKFKTPQQRVLVNLRVTSNFVSNRQNNFMADFGLSMPQFNVLRILRGANTHLSVQVIKERMIEKSPNTTRLMDKLIEKGLIQRTRCSEDKRIVFVEITERGLDVLAQIDGKLFQEDLMATGLSNEEADQLSDLLDKLRKV
jgi:DNA-binding MarR family transcriptional regulator